MYLPENMHDVKKEQLRNHVLDTEKYKSTLVRNERLCLNGFTRLLLSLSKISYYL